MGKLPKLPGPQLPYLWKGLMITYLIEVRGLGQSRRLCWRPSSALIPVILWPHHTMLPLSMSPKMQGTPSSDEELNPKTRDMFPVPTPLSPSLSYPPSQFSYPLNTITCSSLPCFVPSIFSVLLFLFYSSWLLIWPFLLSCYLSLLLFSVCLPLFLSHLLFLVLIYFFELERIWKKNIYI